MKSTCLKYIAVFLLCYLGNTMALAQVSGVSMDLSLVDMQGTKEIIGSLPGTVFAPRLSPDGTQLAYDLQEQQADGSRTSRIMVARMDDLDNPIELPHFNGPYNWAPFWTVDGERIVFIATTEAGDSIYWQKADGTGDGNLLLDARAAESWLEHGKLLSYLTLKMTDGKRDYGISLLNIETGTSEVYSDQRGSEQHSSVVAPNGEAVAYISNETGAYEIWLESYPANGQRFQLTHEGGTHALWSPDSSKLYFNRQGRIHVMSVDTSTGNASPAQELPITGFFQGQYRRQFEIMPDGEHFLMLYPALSN